MNTATVRPAICMLAGLLVWGCTPPSPTQPTYEPTAADLEHAAHHEFDGRYVGTGNVAPGATCMQLVGNWGAMMTVKGPTFVLTPFFNGGQELLYYGNVSPGGVLTNRKNVFVGRIVDGQFEGEATIRRSCRGRFELQLQAPG